jgi:hypothetical protein
MNSRSVASLVTGPRLRFGHALCRHMPRYKLNIIIIIHLILWSVFTIVLLCILQRIWRGRLSGVLERRADYLGNPLQGLPSSG